MEKLDASQRLQPRGGGLPGIFIGFSYPLRTLRLLLKQRSLMPYVLIPLAINMVLGLALYTLGIW